MAAAGVACPSRERDLAPVTPAEGRSSRSGRGVRHTRWPDRSTGHQPLERLTELIQRLPRSFARNVSTVSLGQQLSRGRGCGLGQVS